MSLLVGVLYSGLVSSVREVPPISCTFTSVVTSLPQATDTKSVFLLHYGMCIKFAVFSSALYGRTLE